MQTKILTAIFLCVLIIGGLTYFFTSRETPVGTPAQITVATSTQPVNTYGMSQYTDTAYGFSFWYPNTLSVTATTTQDETDFPGGVAVETLQVGPMGGASVIVVNSPTGTITDEPANHASPIAQTKYFYDSTLQQWMTAFPQGNEDGGSSATTTANVSNTTIAGLLMLPSGRRFDTTIIPLSTTRFLVISDGGGSSFTSQLAQTVAPLNTSVSASAQAIALQAEAAASGQ
jgi:hypothetical protein